MVSELRCPWFSTDIVINFILTFLYELLFRMPIMASLCAIPHSYLPDPVCLSGPSAGCVLVVTISITAIRLTPVDASS